jgi:hypothetical protein
MLVESKRAWYTVLKRKICAIAGNKIPIIPIVGSQ